MGTMTVSFPSSMARVLIPVVLMVGGCGAVSLVCPDALYETSTSDPQVRLPQDESPHCFGGTEWWYYTGRLETQDRAVFGVEAVIFHMPALPFLLLADVWVAHYSILDESSGAFVYDQVRLIEPAPYPPQPQEGFQLDTPIVHMRGGDGRDELACMMGDGSFELQLALTDQRGPVLHGGNGYVPYGANGRSFYYSRPRMRAEGTLVRDGSAVAVAGEFWFDRQWGMDLRNPRQPWDWLSIRLDDGTDIMLFVFPAGGEPVAMGTYVPAGGEPVSLAADEFKIEPLSTWLSPHTGIAYDIAWEVRIPSAGLILVISAVQPDQELDARASTLNLYWEGLCTVSGQRGTQPVTGHAYVEQANAGLPGGASIP